MVPWLPFLPMLKTSSTYIWSSCEMAGHSLEWEQCSRSVPWWCWPLLVTQGYPWPVLVIFCKTLPGRWWHLCWVHVQQSDDFSWIKVTQDSIACPTILVVWTTVHLVCSCFSWTIQYWSRQVHHVQGKFGWTVPSSVCCPSHVLVFPQLCWRMLLRQAYGWLYHKQRQWVFTGVLALWIFRN